MGITELRSDFIPTALFTKGKTVVRDYRMNPTKYTPEQRAILETGMFLNLSVNMPGKDTQVASLSRGLVWDKGENPGEMLAAIIEDIGGKKVTEDDWTGEHSLAVTYEVDKVDLNKLVIKFVYSPARRYQEYMEHLAELAQLSDQAHAESILVGPTAKGKIFKKIVGGQQTELIRAYQPKTGPGFVWNSEKTVNGKEENDWLAIPVEGNKPDSVKRLVTSPGTEVEITRNILGGIDYFEGDGGGKIRIRISGFFDDSVECCVNCSAVQFHKTAEFEDDSRLLQASGMVLLPTLYALCAESPQKKCSECHQKILSSGDRHVCK